MALDARQKQLLEDQKQSGMSIWEYIKYSAAELPASIASGLEKNVSSYPGFGGDMYDLMADTGIVANKWAGATPEQTQALRKEYEAAPANKLPTTEDVHNYLTKNPYTPKTTPGYVAEQVASLAGPRVISGGLNYLLRDVLAPLVASEGAAKVAEWLGLGREETELLTAGSGMGAGPAIEAGKRAGVRTIQGSIAPEAETTMRTLQGVDTPLTPELPNARLERIRRLRDRGIDVTGGQAFGSEALRRFEAGPYSTKGGAQNEAQARQFTRAALDYVGINADTMSPEVVDAAYDRFGDDYQALIRQNNGVPFDGTLQNQLQDIGVRFEGTAGTAKGTHVERFFNRIIDAAHQYGGQVIPPDVFNQIHSEIAAEIRGLGQAPEQAPMKQALRDMQGALYEAIGRNGQPDVQAASRDINNRYRNFKILQKASGGAGLGVSYGLISPEKLRAELERRDPTAYARGQGDLNQLARDAQSLAALPVTGTGAQLAASGLSGLATSTLVNAPISGALTSHPVRTQLVNRALGDHPGFFDPMQMPPVVGMASRSAMPDLPYPGMPAPVEPPPEETAAPPIVPPANAAPTEMPVPVEPVAPGGGYQLGPRSELSPEDMPAPIPVELAELLQGRKLPMRV